MADKPARFIVEAAVGRVRYRGWHQDVESSAKNHFATSTISKQYHPACATVGNPRRSCAKPKLSGTLLFSLV